MTSIHYLLLPLAGEPSEELLRENPY